MAKAKRQLQQNLKVIDLVVEVLDARAPASSRNPDLDALCANKLRLVVLNKRDLAQEDATQQWVRHFADGGGTAIAADSRQAGDAKKVLAAMQRAARPLVERYKARGVNKTVRAMIVGIPNVGKSSLINRLAKGKPAAVGDKPGVTRGTQWVKVAQGIELMDTPGLLWPKLESSGKNIAFLRSIRDEVVDAEALSADLLERLYALEPALLTQKYGSWAGDGEHMLYALCEYKHWLVAGHPDTARGAKAVLEAYRSGALGRYTWELPGE